MDRVKLTIIELENFADSERIASPVTADAVLSFVKAHLSFLPDPELIELDGDAVVLQFKTPGEAKRSAESADGKRQGVYGEEALKVREPASIFYLVDALQRFEGMSMDQIQAVAFEVGIMASGGLRFTDPHKLYTLRSLPGETFTALRLLCFYFVGFQKLDSSLDLMLNLGDAYRVALKLFKAKQDQR